MATENGNYATHQTAAGGWHYHPTDGGWLAFNANDSFSREYTTEEEALADAELQEQMDEGGEDCVIYDSETGEFRP